MLREKLKEYIRACGALDSMTEVINATNDHMLHQLKDEHTIEEITEIDTFNKKYLTLLRGRIDELHEKFIDLYAEYFTEEDIDALLAFQNSPVARKQQEVSKKLLQRAIEISSDFNKELLEQLAGSAFDRQMN